MTSLDVITHVERLRGSFPSEDALQSTLDRHLTQHGIKHEREVRLNDVDRIDFVVGRIGLELKIRGSATAVTRQLQRYAQSSLLDEIVLVTTRSQLCSVPRELSGKPVRVAFVGGVL